MNKHIIKTILGLAFLSATWWSCTEMDAYKDFVREGEKTYSGKADSLTVIGGNNKVMIWGLLKADPKITEARISWSAGAESVTIPINRTSGVDTIKHIIGDIEENNYTFEMVTIDRNGNESVPVYATGSAYGERYRMALNNRVMEAADLTVWDQNTKIVFAELDAETGALGSEIVYEDTQGEEHTIDVSLSTMELVLEDYQVGNPFKIRTFYKPEEHSMDTMSTDFNEVVPRNTYMRNMSVPFEVASRQGRWGNVAHWTTNDNAKIHGGGHGGWDEWNGNIFNLESGWGAPAVTNGKIYQTFEVPAGNFTFRIADLRNTNLTENDNVYLVAAYGDELPNVENLDEAIAYTQVINGKPLGQLAIDFDIEEGPVQISVGYLSTQPDGSPGRFCNIRAFEFTQN